MVRKLGSAYVRTIQSQGFAATIKHFPGDGCDERDQHLVTSINDLSCEEWDNTYGATYKACIDDGALCCMVTANILHICCKVYRNICCPCRCSGNGGSKRRSKPNSVCVTQSFAMQS